MNSQRQLSCESSGGLDDAPDEQDLYARGERGDRRAGIIASADQHPAPLRLVLGSDAYKFVTAALRERLAQIEPQEAAATTDWIDQ